MDANWDLDSVVELCCSKLAHEGELRAFEDAGNLDWLDEKVDLSAWTQLDFPDDLPSVMLEASDLQAELQPDQSSNCGVAPKPYGFWEGHAASPYSPDFLSPPVSPTHSPPTPTAVVPNVDIFLNFGGQNHHGASYAYQTTESGESSSTNSLSPPPTPSALGVPFVSTLEESRYAVASAPASPSYFAAHCSRVGSPVEIPQSVEAVGSHFEVSEKFPCNDKSEPTSPLCVEDSSAASPVESVDIVSPSVTHGSPSTVLGMDAADLVPFDGPQSPASSCSVPSPASVAETITIDVPTCASPDREADNGCEDDSMDADFKPEANRSDSESGLDSASGSEAPPRKTKRTVRRRSRTSADKGGRRERKRLQNKDAATRYRQKKKKEFSKIEEELAALETTNISLQSEAQRITNEISYLKGLMRELFRAKGLIK
uniref:Putative activating transcription factor isoform 1 protein n=1 Tax=Amblyomma aureolatum TaxID=187763 RepID=A0A1E1XIP3_9ACAR